MYRQAAENMSSVWPSLYEKIVDRLRTRHVKDKVIQKLLHSIIEDFDQQTTTGILLKLTVLCIGMLIPGIWQSWIRSCYSRDPLESCFCTCHL